MATIRHSLSAAALASLELATRAWKCGQCKRRNPAYAHSCLYCGW